MALEATRTALSHFPEEALESYAFGRLPDAELACFEEHLLVCELCQQRLDAEDNVAELFGMLRGSEAAELPAFRASSAIERGCAATATAASWFRRAGIVPGMVEFPTWTHSKLWQTLWGITLAAFLTVGLGIATWKLPLVQNSTESDAVSLKTLRGGSADGMTQARANRPLELSVDLGETASSPASGPYRLEVVEATGAQAWTGPGVASDAGRITARIEKRLTPGVYWVRIYASSGKLLREFGLRLG